MKLVIRNLGNYYYGVLYIGGTAVIIESHNTINVIKRKATKIAGTNKYTVEVHNASHRL